MGFNPKSNPKTSIFHLEVAFGHGVLAAVMTGAPLKIHMQDTNDPLCFAAATLDFGVQLKYIGNNF